MCAGVGVIDMNGAYITFLKEGEGSGMYHSELRTGKSKMEILNNFCAEKSAIINWIDLSEEDLHELDALIRNQKKTI